MNERPPTRVRVLSRSDEPFQDRAEAGRLLGEALVNLRGKRPVALGIPRGGIVIAREVADRLDGDLDIVLSRKLGAPGQPELAMGSLVEDGTAFLNPDVVRSFGVSRDGIEQEKRHQMAELQRRSQLIRGAFPKVPLEGRVVVVCDDGVATGATMQAALWAVRHEEPEAVVAAVPVASAEALRRLAADADAVVCLRQPAYFYAVGQAYREFSQVGDEEVMRILEEESDRRHRHRTGTVL